MRASALAAKQAALAVPDGNRLLPSAYVQYVVQEGDEIWDVAVKNGVSMHALMDANKMTQSDPKLSAGSVLLVPSASGDIEVSITADDDVAALSAFHQSAPDLWGEAHVLKRFSAANHALLHVES